VWEKKQYGRVLKDRGWLPSPKEPGERKVLQAQKVLRRCGAVQAAGLFLFFQLDAVPLELGVPGGVGRFDLFLTPGLVIQAQ
jgi:hypothetical protein